MLRTYIWSNRYIISYNSDTTGSLWFYSKDEATNFDNVIANDADFKSLKYKTKLVGSIVADGNDGILRNATIAVPTK